MFGIRKILKKLAQPTLQDPFSHAYYGKIYAPCYNMHRPILSAIPEFYNAEGQRMDMFFLRDLHFADDPYCSFAPPSHWLWDRFNFGLKTHFYSHRDMLATMGSPDRRYGMMIESEAIVPEDYSIFDTHRGLEKDFDLVFTYSERLLDKLDNARFAPFCAQPWYGRTRGGGVLDETAYMRKTKMASILSSDKTMCDLHRYRLDVAQRCKREGLADTFGTFDGGPMVKVAETLTDYRYSFAIENSLSRYFFTERLTSCFLAMTVPIYCGTPAIGEFFNADGIIMLRPGDDLRKVLSQCSVRDYEARLPAIRENYRKALDYWNVWDWLYKSHLGGGEA